MGGGGGAVGAAGDVRAPDLQLQRWVCPPGSHFFFLLRFPAWSPLLILPRAVFRIQEAEWMDQGGGRGHRGGRGRRECTEAQWADSGADREGWRSEGPFCPGLALRSGHVSAPGLSFRDTRAQVGCQDPSSRTGKSFSVSPLPSADVNPVQTLRRRPKRGIAVPGHRPDIHLPPQCHSSSRRAGGA